MDEKEKITVEETEETPEMIQELSNGKGEDE